MIIKEMTLSICMNRDLEKEVCVLDEESDIITIFGEQEIEEFIEKWETTDWNEGEEAVCNTRFLLER